MFLCFISIYNSNTTVILIFDCSGEPLIISAFRLHCRPIRSASLSTDINFLKTPGRIERHQYLPGIGIICYFKELLNRFNLHTIPMKAAKRHSNSSFFYNKSALTYSVGKWIKFLLKISKQKKPLNYLHLYFIQRGKDPEIIAD